MGARPEVTIKPLTTKLVLEPIRVQKPPSTESYENGMRNYEGASFNRRSRISTIGTKTTTTRVLFIQAQTKATNTTTTKNTNS